MELDVNRPCPSWSDEQVYHCRHVERIHHATAIEVAGAPENVHNCRFQRDDILSEPDEHLRGRLPGNSPVHVVFAEKLRVRGFPELGSGVAHEHHSGSARAVQGSVVCTVSAQLRPVIMQTLVLRGVRGIGGIRVGCFDESNLSPPKLLGKLLLLLYRVKAVVAMISTISLRILY